MTLTQFLNNPIALLATLFLMFLPLILEILFPHVERKPTKEQLKRQAESDKYLRNLHRGDKLKKRKK